MKKRIAGFTSRRKVAGAIIGGLAIAITLSTSSMPQAQGVPGSFQILNVNGDGVRISRDNFGVPAITATTNGGLFEGYGYVLAQDRLWQLEITRRASRGRLAEILGPGSLNADRSARRLGYTNAELDQQFALLTSEEQEIVAAFANGINRYVNEVIAPDLAGKLPFEFHYLKLGSPEPWTTQDVVAVVAFLARQFFERGDQERTAQTLLTNLIALHGPADGLAIFNDVQWLYDPDSPASIPEEGAIGPRPHPLPAPPPPSQLQGASDEPDPDADAEAILDSLGVPTSLGSYAWVVGPRWSANGRAMLVGAPQASLAGDPTSVPPDVPPRWHEVALNGGNGFHVRGIAFPGFPMVLIGRNNRIAFTGTTAIAANNADIYVETVCGGGTGTLYQGACVPIETRTEVIKVKGAADDILTVERTVHGPVVSSGPGVRFSRKSSQRNRELQSLSNALTNGRAHNLQEFQSTTDRAVGATNLLYADALGNIAYWRRGQIPVRPSGFDIRLPLPGDGSAEWTGELLPTPTSINPDRGWLTSWNNKATVDEKSADASISNGKQQRVLDIEDRLRSGPISVSDMEDIALDIARVGKDKDLGRLSRYLKPYLLQALDAVPSGHPLAAQARATLESWDGNRYDDAVTSTTRSPGDLIFMTWLNLMMTTTFGDELGADVGRATPNMLIHVLDDALGGGSNVPPSRDYFNGQDPKLVMSNVFTQALNSLGTDPAAWSTRPREVVHFRHILYPAVPEAGSIFDSNRGTYTQFVAFTAPVFAQNILVLGESGFIGLGPGGAPVFDPYLNNLLPLYSAFEYKPMPIVPSGLFSPSLLLGGADLVSAQPKSIVSRIEPNQTSGPVCIEDRAQ